MNVKKWYLRRTEREFTKRKNNGKNSRLAGVIKMPF